MGANPHIVVKAKKAGWRAAHAPRTTAAHVYDFISDSPLIFCLIEAFIPAQTTATSICSVKSACAQFRANYAQLSTSTITYE